MGYSMNMGLNPRPFPTSNSVTNTAGGINPWGQGSFPGGSTGPVNGPANIAYNPLNNPAMGAANYTGAQGSGGWFGGANINYNPMNNPAMAAANQNIATSGGPVSSNINPATGQPYAPGVGGNGYPSTMGGWTTPQNIAANNYVTGPGTMMMPNWGYGLNPQTGMWTNTGNPADVTGGKLNSAGQAYAAQAMAGVSGAPPPAATPAPNSNPGGLGSMFGGTGGNGQPPATTYGAGTNPTNNPGINFPTVGVPQFQQANITPIDTTAAWQAMVAAQQRNIQEGQANLNEQFNTEGGRFSSAYGTAAADYQNQAIAQQNALLGQMQMQSMEQAQSLGVSAGLQTQQLGTQTGLQAQALGEQLTGTQMQTTAQIQAANIAAEAQKAVAQTQVGGQESIAQMETLAQEQEMQSQQAFQGQQAAYNAALQAAMTGSGMSAQAAQELNQAAMAGAQGLYGTANQAAMNMYGGQQNQLGNYMSYLNQQGLNLGSLYGQNLGMGGQLGSQQYNIEQSQINNLIQQWLYSQPQNNPLLSMAYQAVNSYPPVYYPGQSGGALGSLLQGAGGLLGGIGMLNMGGGAAGAGAAAGDAAGIAAMGGMAASGAAAGGGSLADILMLASLLSDKRLKDNIEYTGNEVGGLKEAEWDWKPELGGRHDKGFIAQDVQKTHPDMVVDIGGGVLGVNYKGIASHLMQEFARV